MNGIGIWMDSMDKGLFDWLRTALYSNWLETYAGLLGDIHAWVPMIVFLTIVLYLSKPQSAVFSLFFALATFILSFQAAMLLAKFLEQPSPVRAEWVLHNVQLPAMGRALGLSMPDWAIAAMAGLLHYARLRARQFGQGGLLWGWIFIGIMALLRVYAGFTYPIGAVMAILIGVLLAWLMFRLTRSVEVLSPTMQSPNSDKDQSDPDKF